VFVEFTNLWNLELLPAIEAARALKLNVIETSLISRLDASYYWPKSMSQSKTLWEFLVLAKLAHSQIANPRPPSSNSTTTTNRPTTNESVLRQDVGNSRSNETCRSEEVLRQVDERDPSPHREGQEVVPC
jgi:hypothetical protein